MATRTISDPALDHAAAAGALRRNARGDDHPEYLFRRCCRAEADSMVISKGLVEGMRDVHYGLGRESSDPNKWVSRKPRFTKRYKPKSSEGGMYDNLVILEMAPGTYSQLERMKVAGDLRRGTRGAYGIPPEHLEWFNGRVVQVSAYSVLSNPSPRLIPFPKEFGVTRDRKGRACFFVAFPEHLLKFDGGKVSFGDDLNLERTTWIKTSLMWTIWRSELANKPGMERLVKITVPEDYLEYLVKSAVSSKENVRSDMVIYQSDPNREIGEAALPITQKSFKRSGTTLHFGLRGEALLQFVTEVSAGRMTDITDKTKEFFGLYRQTVGSTATSMLYRDLGLHKGTYTVTE